MIFTSWASDGYLFYRNQRGSPFLNTENTGSCRTVDGLKILPCLELNRGDD